MKVGVVLAGLGSGAGPCVVVFFATLYFFVLRSFGLALRLTLQKSMSMRCILPMIALRVIVHWNCRESRSAICDADSPILFSSRSLAMAKSVHEKLRRNDVTVSLLICPSRSAQNTWVLSLLPAQANLAYNQLRWPGTVSSIQIGDTVMTQETMHTLNTKVLLGYGDYGAWHRMAKHLTGEDNVYPGAIPVDEVMRRLYDFEVEMCKLIVERPDGTRFEQDKFFAQCPDNQDIIYGVHGEGYKGHQYRKWLIEYVQKMLGKDIGICTAACLRQGAMSFVSVRVPDVFKTKHGVEFFTYLMALTSFDGSCSTQYKTGNIKPLCDNTAQALMAAAGNHYKIKHTRNSEAKIVDAMAALRLLEQEQEAFAKECDELCERSVTEDQFQKFLSQLVPLPEVDDKDINDRDYSTRSATIAANKRERLNELYRLDGRAAPWKGTFYGVLQAVNTYNQWDGRNHKDGRIVRAFEKAATGQTAAADLNTLKLLEKVCA